MIIKLITNQTGNDSHESVLKSILENALEVNIAVAFFKQTGYNFIKPYLQQRTLFKIMAGVNFGITDPDALNMLMLHKSTFQNIETFISKLRSKVIFHPKLYMARDKDFCHIITGSANLTSGGLSKNNESSFYVRCLATDQIWNDTLEYFNKCIDKVNADVLNLDVLELYRKYHVKQKKINDQSEPCPDVEERILEGDDKLQYLYNQINKDDLEIAMQNRRERYVIAKQVLDEMLAMDPHSKGFETVFCSLIQRSKPFKTRLWVTNGLFRSKKDIFAAPEKMQALIRAVKDNLLESPEQIFDAALAITKTYHNVGAAYIGEIMMTYDPNRLANINGNPLRVLKTKASAILPKGTHLFKGIDYMQFRNKVNEIVVKLKMESMLEADYFFDHVFNNINKLA